MHGIQLCSKTSRISPFLCWRCYIPAPAAAGEILHLIFWHVALQIHNFYLVCSFSFFSSILCFYYYYFSIHHHRCSLYIFSIQWTDLYNLHTHTKIDLHHIPKFCSTFLRFFVHCVCTLRFCPWNIRAIHTLLLVSAKWPRFNYIGRYIIYTMYLSSYYWFQSRSWFACFLVKQSFNRVFMARDRPTRPT